ncbi:RVT_1 domain-containing protein [Gossypium australe]|uniref:RVT_1 domain-containing protein n=1 Tax=Gossypium australe TaxID=47621 RepID=A0A5B6VWS8_9ROSI|nr:RVT_1 domain-containing protein [Gossypium australe]
MNHPIEVKGSITLPITLGMANRPVAYNSTFGRLIMRMVRIVVAIVYMKNKFLTITRVGYLRSDQCTMRQYHMLFVKLVRELVVEGQNTQEAELANQILDLDNLYVKDKHGNEKIEATEYTETLQLFCNNEESVVFEKKLEHFCLVHSRHAGYRPQVIVHELNVLPKAKPVKQKRRKFVPQVVEALIQEVAKLLLVRFIRKVEYPNWVSNVVMVKKMNSKWRMCINFTNFNKACLKDSFPLPLID